MNTQTNIASKKLKIEKEKKKDEILYSNSLFQYRTESTYNFTNLLSFLIVNSDILYRKIIFSFFSFFHKNIQ